MAIRNKFTSSAVVVQTTPTKLVDQSMGRGSLLISNRGPNAIYLGGTDVTTATGFPIPAGESIEMDETNGAVYAIAETANQATPANTRILVS
jgi:hypothetical protein